MHGYVIMPNHVHDIVSAEQPANLSNIMRDLNRFTSRRISEIFEKTDQIDILSVFHKAAEEGFHPIAIDSEKFFWEKLNYLHENPVRKGLVKQAVHWKYSSARNYYLDDHSTIQIECLE